MATPKDGKEQINVVVTTEQKEEWQEYADRVYGSMSQLVRSSVEGEVNSEGQQSSDVPDDVADTLSEIQQGINRVERDIDTLDTRVRAVETSLQEPTDDERELANDVLDALPDGRESAQSERTARLQGNNWGGPVINKRIADGRHAPLTVDELSMALETQGHRIEDALEQLQSDTHLIRSEEWNGHTCYWSES